MYFHRSESIFLQLPTYKTWLEVADKLHTFFMDEHTDARIRSHFNNLKSLLEVEQRFSERYELIKLRHFCA